MVSICRFWEEESSLQPKKNVGLEYENYDVSKKKQTSMWYSVRAMQSMLDMTVNAKIPDNLVHKLSFERFRI